MAASTSEAAGWIARLALEPHPEGGYFRRHYTAPDALALPRGERRLATVIHYLLESHDRSRLHRLRADELWHFHAGSPLDLVSIAPDGTLACRGLGIGVDDSPLLVIPAGCWFGARVREPQRYTLVSCTVVPGFDFADFELAGRGALLARFPAHRAWIETLTAPDR